MVDLRERKGNFVCVGSIVFDIWETMGDGKIKI